MINILLIEDDVDMQSLLKTFLTGYDIKVIPALDAKSAMQKLQHEKVDIVVLDLMLPDADGHTLCAQIRQKYDIPIIISSARGDLGNKIQGFELGADDYLTKPYEPRELALRLNAMLKRTKKSAYVVGELSLYEEEREICLQNQKLELTRSEYELLKLLMLNPKKAFSRSELAWHLNLGDSNHRTIDTHLSNLRQKLGDDPKNPEYIKSVWGIGYKFLG